jgi:alpha-ketoglutarate-dependent taurine dioxygenase
MAVAVREVSPALGVELRGIDLRAEQPPEVRQVAVQGLRDHHLVLVRGQELTYDDQARFASWFGSIDGRSSRGTDAATYISNTRAEGLAREGSLLKHQDFCFHPEPLAGLSLYAEVAPAVGGETIFASTHRAFDALAPELRARIDGRAARHVYDATSDTGTTRYRLANCPGAPTATHPVAMPHPRTGRPLLFVNELMTDSIVDLPEDDSESLLHELWAYLDDPAVQYRHRWQEGDVIVWDNIALQHGRTPFPPDQPRSLRRLQIT